MGEHAEVCSEDTVKPRYSRPIYKEILPMRPTTLGSQSIFCSYQYIDDTSQWDMNWTSPFQWDEMICKSSNKGRKLESTDGRRKKQEKMKKELKRVGSKKGVGRKEKRKIGGKVGRKKGRKEGRKGRGKERTRRGRWVGKKSSAKKKVQLVGYFGKELRFRRILLKDQFHD